MDASSPKRRYFLTIPHSVSSKRTIISQANVFVILLVISGLDPTAKVCTLGWLKVRYKISVGQELLVTSSLFQRFYAALIEINSTHPSLFIHHVYKHSDYCLSKHVFVCARILSVFVPCFASNDVTIGPMQ
jgi:chorismate mutase